MDLTHQSITGQQFELNRRGYDPDAVDTHLAEIANAVGEQTRRFAELESTVASLQAKVQDANESEEALRLTLKAAAHAKEELLANAREQAKTLEEEAAGRAETMVAQAEARSAELTSAAEARAAAMNSAARSQAGEVAKAVLAESQVLVDRIEELRSNLATAEEALASLQSQAAPEIRAASEALDAALAKAKETAEDPSILENFAAAVPVAAPTPPVFEPEPVAEAAAPMAAESDAEPGAAPVPDTAGPEPAWGEAEHDTAPAATAEPEAPPPPVEAAPEVEAQAAADHDPAAQAAEGQDRHLEVVEPPESAADISDKVDRLLEELREVT